MNFNILTGSDFDESATGFGFLFGSQVDMRFNSTLGILTQVQFYDNRSGSNTVTGQLNGQNASQDNSFSIAYFMIEPLLQLHLPSSGFYFVVGPAVGFSVEGSIEQELTVAGQPAGKGKSSIKNMLVRFAVKAGAGYDIPLSRLMTLAPQFTFGFGITNVVKDVSARALSFQLGTTLKFNLIN